MAYRAKGFNLPERIVFTHSKGTTDITGSYTRIIVEEDIFNLLKIEYVLPENRTALVKFD